MRFHILNDEEDAADFLGRILSKTSIEPMWKNGEFRVGLSGGSVLKYISMALALVEEEQLLRFKFFFCDERYVPETDKDSTFGAYKDKLMSLYYLKEDQFVGMNTNLDLKECAQDYEEKILKQFGLKNGDIPKFDLLVLGLGPDGHTCSLFPNHPLLNEKDRLIATIEDSPKPPAKRITMTLPLINNADMCLFVACGESKADIVKRVFKDGEDLPATMVKPKSKKLRCLLDDAAASLL